MVVKKELSPHPVKQHLEHLLAEKRFADLPALVQDNPAALRKLFTLLYDQNRLLQWRAVLGFGLLARLYPQAVERTVSRLAYALNDEASICAWMSAPALGEMAANNPTLTRRVIRIVAYYLTDADCCHTTNRNEEILCAVLWGVGRLAVTDRPLFNEVRSVVDGFCLDLVPAVRGHAYWALAQAGVGGRAVFNVDDPAPVVLFDPVTADFSHTTVGSLARRVAFGTH